MSILVTGGAGFIGSHVVDCLIEARHEVFVLDDLSGGFRDNINPKAVFYNGSILDVGLVESIFAGHKIEYVFHLAAYAAEGLSHFIRRFNYTNNLVGSMNLINAAVNYGVKCFVFTSSIAVYGEQLPPMRESMVPHPVDPYGISKYAVELDLMAAHEMFGLDYIIFRPHNVYGERQNIGDPYRNVVGIFMNQLMQGLPCTVFGDGNQMRAFTHIADVAPIIAKAPFWPDARNEVFNIGADIGYSVNNLLHKVQNVMGRTTGVVNLPERNEVMHAISDNAKCKIVLGADPVVQLGEGLRRMAVWVKQQGTRRSSGKIFDNIEVQKNMPESWRKLC